MVDGNGNRAALVYDGHMRQNCWMFPAAARPQYYDDATQASALASAGGLGGTISNGQCTSGDYEASALNGQMVSVSGTLESEGCGSDGICDEHLCGPAILRNVTVSHEVR